jgi:hypothetical protein
MVRSRKNSLGFNAELAGFEIVMNRPSAVKKYGPTDHPLAIWKK